MNIMNWYELCEFIEFIISFPMNWEELGACPPLGYWDPFGMMAFQDEEKFRQSKNCRMEWEKVVNQATKYILMIYSINKLYIIHICLWLVMLRHLGVFSFLTCFAMVRRNRELELKHGRICALTSMRCLEVDGCDTVEMHNIIEIL